MNKFNFDIVIVGGGPVGMTCALCLAKKGFSIALIDQISYKNILNANYDGRSFAYAYGSKLILEKYGLWNDLSSYAEPILDIFVSSVSNNQGIHYTYNDFSHPLGYNIETRYFRRNVYQHLKQQKNVQVFDASSIESISKNNYDINIYLKDGRHINSKLLVAADGKNSFIRKTFGIKHKEFSYHQKAITYVISHDKPHNNCAYEYFLKSGPVAVLPMTGNCSAIIWSLNNKKADVFFNINNKSLAIETYRNFGDILGNIKIVSTKSIFPLSVTVVKNYISERLVLIGDSAHSIHPVAGQGFNLGLRDIETLTNVLLKHKNLGSDLGSLTVLKEYEKSRRSDILSMTVMCDMLIRLFSNDYSLIRYLGQKGMQSINKFPVIKKVLNSQAMGLKK